MARKKRAIAGATPTLGDLVRDKITECQGDVVAIHHYLYGCARVEVQPKNLTDDGKVCDTEVFDEHQLDVLKKSDVQSVAFNPEFPRVNLGDLVKDEVTGCEGIVVVRSEYLGGVRRVSVQPRKMDKEGNKTAPLSYFYEGQLKVVTPGVVVPPDLENTTPVISARPMRTGGPAHSLPGRV